MMEVLRQSEISGIAVAPLQQSAQFRFYAARGSPNAVLTDFPPLVAIPDSKRLPQHAHHP
jgi:hypothetical protein